jgi:hypothetical protein
MYTGLPWLPYWLPYTLRNYIVSDNGEGMVSMTDDIEFFEALQTS